MCRLVQKNRHKLTGISIRKLVILEIVNICAYFDYSARLLIAVSFYHLTFSKVLLILLILTGIILLERLPQYREIFSVILQGDSGMFVLAYNAEMLDTDV